VSSNKMFGIYGKVKNKRKSKCYIETCENVDLRNRLKMLLMPLIIYFVRADVGENYRIQDPKTVQEVIMKRNI